MTRVMTIEELDARMAARMVPASGSEPKLAHIKPYRRHQIVSLRDKGQHIGAFHLVDWCGNLAVVAELRIGMTVIASGSDREYLELCLINYGETGNCARGPVTHLQEEHYERMLEEVA